MKRLYCSYFVADLRLDYVLKMFLFLKKNEPLCYYKLGSYKKKTCKRTNRSEFVLQWCVGVKVDVLVCVCGFAIDIK